MSETPHIGFITLDIVASMDYLSAYLVSQKKIAPVAQWIERQPPELEVAGSNPAGRTSNKIANLGANLKLAFLCSGRTQAEIYVGFKLSERRFRGGSPVD